MKIIYKDQIRFGLGFVLETKNKTHIFEPFVILDNWRDTLYCFFIPVKVQTRKSKPKQKDALVSGDE